MHVHPSIPFTHAHQFLLVSQATVLPCPTTALLAPLSATDLARSRTATLTALRSLRLMQSVAMEYDLHREVSAALEATGLRFEHEVQLAPRNRIDFLVEGGIGIEVKKGKPNATRVRAQVERYCRLGALTTLVLMVERSTWGIPSAWTCAGVAVHYIALNKLWGIAL